MKIEYTINFNSKENTYYLFKTVYNHGIASRSICHGSKYYCIKYLEKIKNKNTKNICR
jgi:hypothetical protein